MNDKDRIKYEDLNTNNMCQI